MSLEQKVQQSRIIRLNEKKELFMKRIFQLCLVVLACVAGASLFGTARGSCVYPETCFSNTNNCVITHDTPSCQLNGYYSYGSVACGSIGQASCGSTMAVHC
jgi:hypothetical protein